VTPLPVRSPALIDSAYRLLAKLCGFGYVLITMTKPRRILLVGFTVWMASFLIVFADSKRPVEMRSETFTPQPIKIALDDLPRTFKKPDASRSPRIVPPPQNPLLKLPKGFHISVYAEGLHNPRWLALTPGGDVLVTEDGAIKLLEDKHGHGIGDQITIFAGPKNGLNQPFGIAFSADYFFVANTDSILRFPYTSGQKEEKGTGEKIASLPAGGRQQPWARNIALTPDGKKLYLSLGIKSISENDSYKGGILTMNVDGSEAQILKNGLRNPVGLGVQPFTGKIYATVNEHQGSDDDLVPDYFTEMSAGKSYGWPYAYVDAGAPENPNNRVPDVLFQTQNAGLGVTFYTSPTFPAHYYNGAFVAVQGTWNRNRGRGCKIIFIPFNDKHEPVGAYEDFVTGFLNEEGTETWAEPVGISELPDGSIIFTDDVNGRIYRVRYTGAEKPKHVVLP
jgi:glucose/arabinose dehydrogenase